MKKSIFRAYDVRGRHPKEINEEVAYRVGRAFAVLLRGARRRKKVVVSRDARKHSPSLSRALIKGLADAGADVYDVGLTTTPMHVFAVNFLKAGGGVMVTASHNPPSDNGFKFCFKSAYIGRGGGLENIEKIYEKEKSADRPFQKRGRIVRKNVLGAYLDFVVKTRKRRLRNLKIAADAGNGSTGPELKALTRRLRFKLVPLFFRIDGRFPGRGSNPLKKGATRSLAREVLKTSSDFGAAFDADGDRVVFVDEKGKPIRTSLVAALIASRFLKKRPGAEIWHDVAAGRVLDEVITAACGRPVVGKVGRTNARRTMTAKKIIFGAESSGHYYFRDFFFSDSGILAFLCVAGILSEEKKPLSELIRPFQKYFASGEINIKIQKSIRQPADKNQNDSLKIKNLLKRIENKYENQARRLSYLDGLTVEAERFWFNLRPSNTENFLRLNAEAKDKNLLLRKVGEIKKLVFKN